MGDLRRIESCTSSGASELTRERPFRFAHSSMDSLVTESISTEWTDEKHSLYLKSIEASFINQLNDSMNSVGWNLEREKLSGGSKSSIQKHFSISNASSDQFKVFRCGCWKMIDFERPAGYQLCKRNESYCHLACPWIQRFRTGSKRRGSASSIEMSDQNFVDEDQVDKGSAKCRSKRLKVTHAASCNDQLDER